MASSITCASAEGSTERMSACLAGRHIIDGLDDFLCRERGDDLALHLGLNLLERVGRVLAIKTRKDHDPLFVIDLFENIRKIDRVYLR